MRRFFSIFTTAVSMPRSTAAWHNVTNSTGNSTRKGKDHRLGGLFWCGRWDLNPYALRHTPLKRTCLPIPALPLDPANCILSHFAVARKSFFIFGTAFLPEGFSRMFRSKGAYNAHNSAARFSHGALFPDKEYPQHWPASRPRCHQKAIG